MSLEDQNAGEHDPSKPLEGDSTAGQQPGTTADRTLIQPLHHDPVSARVPERVSRGTFATGLVVQEGPGEFVLDFIQALTRPPQVASRVVITPGVMQALVKTLGENIQKYTQSFGSPPPLPRLAPGQRQPTTQELYEALKLPEDQLSGVYANSVLVGHQPAEFFMDFITRFYPTAAVSSRIYFSASQSPRMLDILSGSLQQHLRRRQQPPGQPPGNTSEPPSK